ncbi:DUF4832 domain-containing protein [Fibrobacter sp.]|uniref:DUF4832 domain-containing protein n=1 Tax=Fibrobacter sp. TaxID=35828 RepID=UPI00388E19A8
MKNLFKIWTLLSVVSSVAFAADGAAGDSALKGSAADGVTRDSSGLVLQDLDYTDHLQTLPNYDRGFYYSQALHIKVSGTKPIEKPYGKLLHLRADIAEFSSQAWMGVDTTGGKRDTTWGKSQDLTEDALNVLQTTFDNVRNFGGKVIVRICYDPWFDGHSNTTPEHKWVMRHIEQLAPVLSKNVDVIVALEMGMHGAFGEMHSDTAITYPRVAEAVNKMLQLTPPELKILTRTGNYSAAVLGFENWGVDFHIDGDVFKQIAEAKGDTMYRVGMFNDGYLGTQYDYGTWGADCKTSICREEGVAWLEKYSINTPYGGEAVETANGYEVINTPEFLAHEGFRTHTSYLNLHWNNNVIDRWKAAHFSGKDYEYDGTKIDTLTGFKFIDDHLGYRYVLRESWLPDTVFAGEKLKGKLKIQNVGFGNLTQKRNAKLYFVTDECKAEALSEEGESILSHEELKNVDFRDVHSRTIKVEDGDTTMTFDGTNEIDFEVEVPQKPGSFSLYLLVDDVYFANEMDTLVHPVSPNAVPLGSFFLTSKKNSDAIPGGRALKRNKPAIRVERADQKIQIRDSRALRDGTRDGRGDRIFRVNGCLLKSK